LYKCKYSIHFIKLVDKYVVVHYRNDWARSIGMRYYLVRMHHTKDEEKIRMISVMNYVFIGDNFRMTFQTKT